MAATFLNWNIEITPPKKVLFSRQYALADKHLKSVLKQSSLDLMRVLNVANAEQRAVTMMAGVPSDPEALGLFIRANII